MCANTRLVRLLLAKAGESATIQSSTQAEWQQGLFSGSRHQICMGFTDKANAEAFVAWVDDESKEEPILPGGTLAELTVLEVDEIPPLGHMFIVIEALTLNNL